MVSSTILDLLVLVMVLICTGGIMVVPDGAVWAAIPVLGATLAWAGKQFVLSITGKKTAPEEMSVKAYRQLVHMFQEEFMSAREARRLFNDLEGRMNERFEEMKTFVQNRKV
jgi:hypothetical protein